MKSCRACHRSAPRRRPLACPCRAPKSRNRLFLRASRRALPPCRPPKRLRNGRRIARVCVFFYPAHLKKVVADLSLHYPLDTPVALVHRVSWRDERIHRSTLGKLLSEVRAKDWQLTTLLLIGETLEERPGVESSLYAARFTHRFRRAAVRRRRIG